MRVEYHYCRPEARSPTGRLATYASGDLTTDHAASSHGLPVFVAHYNMRRNDPMPLDMALGPADLPPINGHECGGLCAAGARSPADVAMLRAAFDAGYAMAPGSCEAITIDDRVI